MAFGRQPNGKLLDCFSLDEQTKRLQLAVITFEAGATFKTFDLPLTAAGSEGLFPVLHWSPDSQALIYINTIGDISNLWRQPLDGGAARQITNFKSDHIFNFAYSRDGRQLAFARGNVSSDAVMVSEVK